MVCLVEVMGLGLVEWRVVAPIPIGIDAPVPIPIVIPIDIPIVWMSIVVIAGTGSINILRQNVELFSIIWVNR